MPSALSRSITLRRTYSDGVISLAAAARPTSAGSKPGHRSLVVSENLDSLSRIGPRVLEQIGAHTDRAKRRQQQDLPGFDNRLSHGDVKARRVQPGSPRQTPSDCADANEHEDRFWR